jgi:predicted phosphohydrolase
MKVYGIGDLHLSSSGEKPMDVFGPEWADHDQKIARNWRETVAPEDLVLICGDLSWAMRLPEAQADLDLVESLPGVKYFIRGNHDYWCAGPAAVRRALGPSMHYIRNDAAVHGGVGICGVRGWVAPGHPDYHPEEDARHWQRAIIRLGLSLEALGRLEWQVAVAMCHHPPRTASGGTELSALLAPAGVRHCIYGHLHGPDAAGAFEGEADGVLYRCVSADRVGFRPILLFEHPAR